MENDVNNKQEDKNSEKKRGVLIFDTWFGKWFIQRIPAFLVWYWFYLLFLNKPLPFDLPLERVILLLPAMVSAILMIIFSRWSRLAFYPIYIFFFPALIFWYIFRLVTRILTIPIRVTRIARSTQIIIILIIIIISGWTLGILLNNQSAKAVSILIAHISLYILFLQSFRWASNPYKPIVGLVTTISDKFDGFINITHLQSNLQEGGQARRSALALSNWGLKAIDFLYPSKDPLEGGLTGFTHSQLVPTSIFAFVLLYAVLASSFSITLYEIERAWGVIIAGLSEYPNITQYLYFSFLSQATAVPDGIRPVSLLGQIWIVWIVLTGVLLLTLLLATFTTAIGVHGEIAQKELGTSLNAERERYQAWIDKLSEEKPQAQIENNNVVEGESIDLE